MTAAANNTHDQIVDGSTAELSAVELISAFKDADMRLRLAIEQDCDADIEHYGETVDQLVSAMLTYDAQGRGDQATLLRFLVDRFVLRDDCGEDMRRAVCDKLLALV